jgi:NitT/TauT family transport system ATP-binding protein
MRQRVNWRARSSPPRPAHPGRSFPSIDLNVKLRLMKAIDRRWQSDKFTLLCVTHDPREALFLADRIILLSARPASILLTIGVDMEKSRISHPLNFMPGSQFDSSMADL